jgi:peptidoglycan hydrolase-like protein with peptidoglycan-binding domain
LNTIGKLVAAGLAAALGVAVPATATPAAQGTGPIATMQARLAALGYAPGPINGVMSAKTERAMQDYRRAAGRPIAGEAAGDPIAAAQLALQQLGFLAGPADGAVGPQTRDAIIRFQAARHLPIDPRVSDQLLAALAEAEAPAAPSGSGPASAPPVSPAEPEITGRQPLPPGVAPPPIR